MGCGGGLVQDSRLCMTVIKRNKRTWQTVILKEGQNTRTRGAWSSTTRIYVTREQTERTEEDLLGARPSPRNQGALSRGGGCGRICSGLCDLAHPMQVRGIPLLHRQCNHLSNFVRVHRSAEGTGLGLFAHPKAHPNKVHPTVSTSKLFG